MICDDDAAAVGQILQTIDLGTHAGQEEGGARCARDEPAAPLETGNEHGDEK